MASREFYRKAATASWNAPLLAIGIHSVLRGVFSVHTPGVPTMAMVFAGAIALLMLGCIAGVVALCGVSVHGCRGILAPAIIGIGLNGLIVLGILAAIGGTLAKLGAAPQQAAVPIKIPSAEDDRHSVCDYPGWMGVSNTEGGVIAVGTLDDRSPSARVLLDEITCRCSIIALGIENAHGSKDLFVVPSSLRLTLADGTVITALDPQQVLATARHDSVRSLMPQAETQCAETGQPRRAAFCFIPTGVDPNSIRKVSIEANMQRIEIPGRCFSIAEKQARYTQSQNTGTASAE